MQDAIFIGRQLSTHTKAWLNKSEVTYAEHALIDITLKDVKDTHITVLPSEENSWIVTSQWSALWLAKHHHEIGFEAHHQLYCLSSKQAEILAGLTKKIFIADKAELRSLVEKVKEKHTGEGLICLKGNRSLRLIEEKFRADTYNLRTIEVYKNNLIPVKLEKDFDAYLFFSPSGIQSFKEARNKLPQSASVFTIGTTTGEKAKKNFSNPVYEASSQSELEFVKSVVKDIKDKTIMTQENKNKSLFERAQKSIPGGVNSPVRSFSGIGGTPTFVSHAKGSFLYDVNGKEYIDYLGSWGPMIFGHAWPPVVKAVQEQVLKSSSYGLASEKEIELAELLVSIVPGVEMLRLVNSGTEACMTAVRIARAATNKDKIIKFNGCYHGHADTFLVNAGSGLLTLGQASSPGILKAVAEKTLTAEFNDLESVKTLLEAHEVAAIIVEPVAGNMGCIPPDDNFLQGLRDLTTAHDTLLIFDEVMTGFRLALGGAQELYQVEADLVTYGKIIGGGFPVGAVAGKAALMNLLSPVGPVYQGGTLSGNPIATSAGIAVLSELKNKPIIYQKLEDTGRQLQERLQTLFSTYDIPVHINRVGSMISLFFSEQGVSTFKEAVASDMDRFSTFFHQMLKRGIHLPPSGYETWFLSSTLSQDLIDKTIKAAEESIQYIITEQKL